MARQVPPSYFEELKKQRSARGKNSPEVLFPNEFTPVHPWGEIPEKFDDKLPPKPVFMEQLSHVTHDDPKEKIEKTREFLVKEKVGKTKIENYSEGKSIGESYISNTEHTSFSCVNPDDAIFPGFYSWWGIHPTQSFKHPSGVDVVNYLKKDQPESPYGNWAFICNFQDLLTAYATSRKCSTENICLRKGGTLRYKQEICYVIIISCSGVDDSALSNFDPLKPQSDQFNMNGLIDEDGRICNIAAIPEFKPQYIVKYDGRKNYSYETVALAFFYPQIHYTLKLSFSLKEITHKPCIRTIPLGDYEPWVCPNKKTKTM